MKIKIKTKNGPDDENDRKRYLQHLKRYKMKFIYLFFFSICLSSFTYAQYNTGNVLLINMGYGAEFPSGDLKERFGNSSDIMLGLEFMTNKGNYIIGIDGSFLFGRTVKEDPLANLRTFDGNIIGNDRDYANLQLRQRGFYTGGYIGKLLGLFENNPRSGIRITAGVGLLQHKIRYQDDPERQVAAISGDYRKGYDRLTNGLAFNEFIGYQILSNNRRVNVIAGLELMQAFTQSRRDIDFDTMMKDDRERKDFLYGFKVALVLPLYLGGKDEEIFY